VRVLEHVLVGNDGRRAAKTLLNVRPFGDGRFRRSRPAVGPDQGNEQALPVRHPLHVAGTAAASASSEAGAHDLIDAHILDTARLAEGITDPELYSAVGRVR